MLLIINSKRITKSRLGGGSRSDSEVHDFHRAKTAGLLSGRTSEPARFIND